MGYMIATGTCINCGRLFQFNPELVPSVRVNGHREPACLACVEAANPQRRANGLEEIRIHPGAYQPQECH